ncbi:MAG TPA: hypothetical protein VMA31_00165 [Bryobacteraceae bacterium]|nr:hypothetical protein [Bryobacteraceae bacterium]
MAVLAIFSPAIASAQAGGSDCHATPKETHKELPWAGNAGEIQWSADQLDCKVDTGGLPWITVSVLPPVSGAAGLRVLRYSVDTNFSSARREGKIEVGDATVTLEQAAGPAPGMAFSPGRLDFTIASGTPQATKTLYVGSEEPLLFAATPAAAAPWLKVKDTSDVTTPQKRRSYLVTVVAEGKAPGVYQSTIELDAPGASNAKEVVPVTMTVEKAK